MISIIMSKFNYITTPLYYVNSKPHLGTAYTTLIAQSLKRYKQLLGEEAYLLTGVDEHGQKIQEKAKERGIEPQAHCDEMSKSFEEAWNQLEIKTDQFYRTTDEEHKTQVQQALQSLFDKNLIEARAYEGWYCPGDEIFYPEKDLVDGKSPTGKKVERISEKNYFFKMSKFQKQLIEHIEAHPNYLLPKYRANEILSFLKNPLEDLSISRPKTRINWGIELPFDNEHVTYVWFDALLNYAFGAGALNSDKQEQFEKFWQNGNVIHLIGKDILLTHSIYWTSMLMALELPLPNTIFAHGYILNSDNEKMSKSQGATLDPLVLAEKFGAESLNYYLNSAIRLGNDAPFSEELFIQKINVDLSNNIGNLLSRTTNLIAKNYEGQLNPEVVPKDALSIELKSSGLKLYVKLVKHIESFEISQAIDEIIVYLNQANQYLEHHSPWKLVKTDKIQTEPILLYALESLRLAASFLEPLMPKKMHQIFEAISYDPKHITEDIKKWSILQFEEPIKKAPPLFPRIS